jgi:polar amino acid transport system substrate-binding protein
MKPKHRFAVPMTAALLLFVMAGLVLLAGGSVAAQAPVPTLVPPTLVPFVESGMSDALASESTLAQIRDAGEVRVGILYNEPPFGELNIRGEVSGFDADLARAMGEAWGVDVNLIQVTRQTALDMLVSGAVDILMAAQPHLRQLDSRVEFSQTYYPGQQVMAVRQDDGATVLGHMNDRKVGVVMNTRSEDAVSEWLNRTGQPVTVERFINLDQAVSALLTNQVDGIVGSRVRLTRAFEDASLIRYLDEPVGDEPLAVVMRRQDVNLRNLINRTLQFFLSNGKLNEIHETHFSGTDLPANMLPVWANVGENAPTPDQFATDIPYPPQYAVPQIQNNGVVRVAGVADVPGDADESVRRLDAVNRSVVEAMAARWGARVEYIPNSVENALDLVASGQADIAVGVEPDWNWADRVDFSQHYMIHGDRLMVPFNSEIEGFGGLRTEWVGFFASEEGAKDRVYDLAEDASVLLSGDFTIFNEEDAAFGMTAQANYDAVFGDSLKLVPHVQADPEGLRLTTGGENAGWYSRHFLALAMPRNDLDFRTLVDYTLQEMSHDGTLASLVEPVMIRDEVPHLELWPGPSDYLGYRLAGQ